jgi:small subunit ribosomal protein S6
LGRFYETIFIINPESENVVVEQTIDTVRNFIESNGYEVKKVAPWGRRRLAYEVKGHQEGYYVLMVFESEPDFVEQLQRRYQITEPIIKYMVVRFEDDLAQLSTTPIELPEESEDVIEDEQEESDVEFDETEEE